MPARRVSSLLYRAPSLPCNPLKGRGGVGIALYPAHGTGEETLPHHADVAMYAAKRAGGGHGDISVVREHDPPGD